MQLIKFLSTVFFISLASWTMDDLIQQADEGDAGAQNDLGIIYYHGRNNIEKDIEKAAVAQGNLGDMYRDREEYENARFWYEKAALNGNKLAQLDLGIIYRDGKGVNQNYEKALLWFLMAANGDDGLDTAKNNIGHLYFNGFGVQQHYGEARKWFIGPANKGDPYAQYMVGAIAYIGGLGANQNQPEGLTWFLRSAEQGFADAQYKVGYCYFHGYAMKGKDKSKTKAEKYLKLAAAQGNQEAIKFLEENYGCTIL